MVPHVLVLDSQVGFPGYLPMCSSLVPLAKFTANTWIGAYTFQMLLRLQENENEREKLGGDINPKKENYNSWQGQRHYLPSSSAGSTGISWVGYSSLSCFLYNRGLFWNIWAS